MFTSIEGNNCFWVICILFFESYVFCFLSHMYYVSVLIIFCTCPMLRANQTVLIYKYTCPSSQNNSIFFTFDTENNPYQVNNSGCLHPLKAIIVYCYQSSPFCHQKNSQFKTEETNNNCFIIPNNRPRIGHLNKYMYLSKMCV
jgi:hypothetical protein